MNVWFIVVAHVKKYLRFLIFQRKLFLLMASSSRSTDITINRDLGIAGKDVHKENEDYRRDMVEERGEDLPASYRKQINHKLRLLPTLTSPL